MDLLILQSLIKKAVDARRAAEAARKARHLIRKKSLLTRSTLPGQQAPIARRY